MTNPLNQLPLDAEWVRKCDEIAENAARELGCDVVLIAGKENAKTGVCIAGTGAVAKMFHEDMPRALANMAMTLAVSQAFDDQEPRQ